MAIKPKASKKKITIMPKKSNDKIIKKKISELENFKKKMASELGKIKVKYFPGKAVNNTKKEISKGLDKIGDMFKQGAKKILK